MGLIRNHYVGRTFIEPQQSIRHFGVRVKLNPVRELLKGKRVVLLDDSIVRGTTSPQDREDGARGRRVRGAHADQLPADDLPVLLRRGYASPERADCGDAHRSRRCGSTSGADTLSYLSLEGMLASVGDARQAYCTSCYTGHYPVAFPRDRERYLQLALKLQQGQRPAGGCGSGALSARP